MKPILTFLLALAMQLAAAGKPNIVFVITDDLGYGDLSCYGQKSFQTPNLDRLAAQGIRFTDHYSGATVCAPSRCCLMTGRDTGHASIRGNGPFALRPDPEDLTVATILRDAGYSTALIGKSCVTGNTQTPETLKAKGFDYFYGTTDHKDGHFRYPPFVYENSERVVLEGNTRYAGPHYDLDLYARKALEFIGKSNDKPFFMVLSLPVPHASLAVPEESMALVRPGIGKDSAYSPKDKHYGDVKEVKASYAGMVVRVDSVIGSILESLKSRGIDENSMVMFTSDNGSHVEGGYHYSMLESNGQLRGGKRDLYEGGIRVPFIARWPGGIPAGQTTGHPSAFWDFLPTVCDLTGAKVPTGIEGISYAPTLAGKAAQQAKHEALYWEFHELNGRRALRMDQWKLVQYGLKPGAFGEAELYDLANDVSENNNLAKKHPERMKSMLERLDQSRVANDRFALPGLDARTR